MDASNRVSKITKVKRAPDRDKLKKRGHWNSRKAIEAKRVGSMYYYSKRFSAESEDIE